MTPAKAKVIFATHMQASGKRKLHAYELKQLSEARQVLRQQRRPAMNPRRRFFKSRSEAEKHMIKLRRKGIYSHVAPETEHGLYVLVVASKKESIAGMKRISSAAHGNPKRGVLIYGQVQTIYAKKTQPHVCDDDCKAHNHQYYHKFSSKPKMYGLPDGTL